MPNAADDGSKSLRGASPNEPICHMCGGRVESRMAHGERGYCVQCGAFVRIGKTRIEVHGEDASEVATVARQLSDDAAARDQVERLRSPWVSGTFYLAVVVVTIALLMTVGRILAIWALPFVIIGSILLLIVVGAFQLRQDERLEEVAFLRLMTASLKRLPLLISKRSDTDRNSD